MEREFRDRHDSPGRDPESEFEDEGIPDLQEGSPVQDWSEDPQRAPIPREEPTAVEDYGVTPAEQATGEPLDDRLRREVPDDQPGTRTAPAREDPTRPAGRLVAPDEGAHPDEEKDEEAAEAGPDAGGYTAEEDAMRVRRE